MKKLQLLILLYITAGILSAQKIQPNVIVSRSKKVYTSRGIEKCLSDNKFKNKAWCVTDTCWIAVNITKGPGKIFINWNNPAYPWANELSPARCPNSISVPKDYDILTSSNSTNGADGDWKIVCIIRDNIVSARGHLVDFEGADWVKMFITKGGGDIDEFEVFDASKGLNDSWFFVGTSISANTYKGTPPSENFADLIHKVSKENNPVMIRGGIGCISSDDLVKNLPQYLKNAGNIKYWAIEMGTNDAWGGSNKNAERFRQNLQIVIDSCRAIGIEPIIAHVLATNPAISKWQIHPDYQKVINELTQKNNLIEGPDLYSWFLSHPEEIIGENDGVHPNKKGAASIQRLWAEKLSFLYKGKLKPKLSSSN